MKLRYRKLSSKNLYPVIMLTALLISASIFFSCEQSNIFSDKDDVELGKEFDKQIKADPTFHMLEGHEDIKTYVTGIGKYIINTSPKITKKDIYPYNFQVINDTIVNAFCTPGGFVYVYTGHMKCIDNEATLAGIMAHQIAHADGRHVTQRQT